MDNNEKIFRDENNSESSSPQEPVSVTHLPQTGPVSVETHSFGQAKSSSIR